MEYKKGVENQASDALSQRHEEEVLEKCKTITILVPSWLNFVKEMIATSGFYKLTKDRMKELYQIIAIKSLEMYSSTRTGSYWTPNDIFELLLYTPKDQIYLLVATMKETILQAIKNCKCVKGTSVSRSLPPAARASSFTRACMGGYIHGLH